MRYTISSMNEVELQKLVEKISLESFHRPFTHQVKINRRMRTTGGRYFLNDHHIDINARFLEEPYQEYLAGIIKHELTHYHLHLLGLGYQHRDRDFKQTLARVGGSRYAPDIGLRNKKRANYVYQCEDCGQLYPRVRKVNVQRMRCGRCRGHLKLIKQFKK